MALSVVEEKAIDETHVHIRGLVHNLGEKARGFLQVATTGPAVPFPDNESGRRQLRRLAGRRRQPADGTHLRRSCLALAVRHGLVRTDNFGTTGELPSHPELLDSLARRSSPAAGRSRSWSVRSSCRTPIASPRSATSGPAIDPENRLLSHANRRRLEAECIRDTLLAVSGQLAVDRGGPTFTSAPASNYNYRHTDRRRSVYSRYSAMPCPNCSRCSTSPTRAWPPVGEECQHGGAPGIYLMNHPFVLEQARQAARRLLAGPQTDDAARLDRAAACLSADRRWTVNVRRWPATSAAAAPPTARAPGQGCFRCCSPRSTSAT